jgi:ribosome-associated heat shock protein Hsp15
VRINGVRCEKPSATVKAGDVLTLSAGTYVRVIKVLSGGERRGPASEAQLLYEDLTPPAPPRDAHAIKAGSREHGAGRPTKKERRDIKEFTRDTGSDE